MKTKKNIKSIEVIENLINKIEWLGGDAYEMEAVEETINEARKHLKILNCL